MNRPYRFTGAFILEGQHKAPAAGRLRWDDRELEMVYNNSMSGHYDESDLFYMKLALEQAREADACGEVPVGAVLVREGRVLAACRNRCEELKDATAHAEILALREGSRRLGGWRLTGTTLYVTLEPCPMCAGALVQARVERLVYGAADPKGGACGTLYNLVQDERLNHRLAVTGGVMADECAVLLQGFFRRRRG